MPARASLLPLLLFAAGGVDRCELSTDAGTGRLRISGTVRFLDVEGGCWQVVATDGRRYELLSGQAPPAVLRDGALVGLVVEPRAGTVGACRDGVPVDVERVEKVEGP